MKAFIMNPRLPDIKKDFPDWYQEVVYQAELVDQAPVRGCIVIRPYGYAIWELMKSILDAKIKESGHQNAAFPLFIPQSFINREAQHVKGFSPELAVVTHAGGKELEEPLVVRPTSETVIHYMFARWIKSWRDLPVKINQWCSVVRWEKRPRPFLRTSEFWWQEGHTAHETYEEALQEAILMRDIYKNFMTDFLCIPVIAGRKSESEKFAGADITFTMEGVMQDGKALQMGTSHMISQNFARSFGIIFQDREGRQSYPYLTSWGVTTRMIGAAIMTHGDQKGLVLPPAISPYQIIIIPIFKAETKESILLAAESLKNSVSRFFRVLIDADEGVTPGAKFYKWELKGVPIRIEIGPRELQKGMVILSDRINSKPKEAVCLDIILDVLKDRLEYFSKELLARATHMRDKLWHKSDKVHAYGPQIASNNGLYQTGWCRSEQCEEVIKTYKATIRCVLPDHREFDFCCNCDKKSQTDILVAKAY